MTKTIELDCAPGGTRPGDLIMGVVAGTILEEMTTPENAVSRIFGEWTWAYPDVTDEAWLDVQPTIEARIKALYRANRIRFGSW